ncbi:hypothetical protein [Streptomyces sp. NPDC051173]|uniref:hypothetical protein n=1 Tax=Streptomyces sp. NPDC051173 TaxID=3155164 RepID=UPI00344D6CEF
MTLMVYRITQETGQETVIKEKHTVKPVDVAITGQYPPCECSTCTSRERRRGQPRAGVPA